MAATAQTSETTSIVSSFGQSASSYESRMGAVTRAFARHIVSTLPASVISADAFICDNACGTGAVTDALLTAHPNVRVEAIDISPAMVDAMQRDVDSRGESNKVEVALMDSLNLRFPGDTFSANVMNFGIFFASDDQQVADEIFRTLKPAGVAVLTCWKKSPLGPLLLEVQEVIKPVNPTGGLSNFDKWTDPETLRSVLHQAGFAQVVMEEYEVILTAKSISELSVPLSENLKVIVGDKWSGEERSKIASATESILRANRDDFLVVDGEEKGVSWIAWIATAQKQER